MRKYLLVTAAFVATLAVSVVSGAGTAGASTTRASITTSAADPEFCVGEICATNYRHYPTTIPYTDVNTGYTLEVVPDQNGNLWIAQTFANAGKYWEDNDKTKIDTNSITLRVPADLSGNWAWTCITFPATGSPYGVSLVSPKANGKWEVAAANCDNGTA